VCPKETPDLSKEIYIHHKRLQMRISRRPHKRPTYIKREFYAPNMSHRDARYIKRDRMRNCERDLKKGFERNRKGNVKTDLYPSKRTLCSSKQT